MIYPDWQTLKEHCLGCQQCDLCKTRRNVVFGVGPEDADVLFIGEGPGEQEDRTGEPFVGRAGQFLDQMLSIIGLSRRNCYIGNIVKCRPPNNRDPLESEQSACNGWLTAQIELIQPKIIICLGRIAAMKYIDPNFRITREHGRWFEQNGRQMMAMYHPSALLRDPSKRPETFRDLKSLQAMVKNLCPDFPFED